LLSIVHPSLRFIVGSVDTVATAGVLIAAMLVGLPSAAAAQPEEFFRRLTDLTTALEGIYGDERPQIGDALDQMSLALAEWDRRIRAFEARRATESSNMRATVDARVSLARMYAQRGRIDDALREIDEAIRLDSKRADVHLLRGLVLDASGRPDDANDAFANAFAMDGDDPIAAYYLLRHATGVVKAGDAQTARATLAATHRRLMSAKTRPNAPPFPESGFAEERASGELFLPLAVYANAYQHIARREYDEAIAEFRMAAAVDPMLVDPVTESHRKLGLAHWVASDDAKSIEQFASAIERNPRDERSRLALFQIFRMTERDADAVGTLLQALRVLPDSRRAHWWLGVSYERLNRFVEARQEFERAAEGVVTGRGAVFVAIGRLAAREADLPATAAAFARAIGDNPNDPTAHKNMAGVLMQQDRLDDAFVEWVAALLIDPRDPDAHAGIGQLLLNMGRINDAVDALRRAVELSPDYTDARYALAIALRRLGKTQEADREFARVEVEQRRALAERRRQMSIDVSTQQETQRTDGGGVR
jgi:tetratricopeptide (TPR) repeat protein